MKKQKRRNTTTRITKTLRETMDIDTDKISYKNYDYLSKFITDRGKIMGKDKTGLSSTDQRRLTTEIKRARHLGLLPFVSGL